MTLRNPNTIAGVGSNALPQSVIDDMMNRKKTGRKVIDWTPSCALYLEVSRFVFEFYYTNYHCYFFFYVLVLHA